ncbi:MAG TPA: hypothetical protein VFG70_06760 [Gaiellaceae bacterium]|nr:hypothetical protein [Gaiellaceae bacterium]
MTPPQPNSRTAYALVAALAALASAFVALALSAPADAAAKTVCGDKVLADWFDNGRIDRLYPLHCYEDAIDAIPDDLRDYADAEQVINRALQSALRGQLAPGGRDPSPGSSGGTIVPGGPGSGGPDDPNGSGTGGGEVAAPEVDTSAPSSVPIPLLVLGGMSIALLAAGGLGYLSRRRQAAHDELPPDDFAG